MLSGSDYVPVELKVTAERYSQQQAGKNNAAMINNSIGKAVIESDDITVYYNDLGAKIGHSEEHEQGITLYYDRSGQRIGDSQEHGQGIVIYSDASGTRIGSSTDEGEGITTYLDGSSNGIGHSEIAGQDLIVYYDEYGKEVGVKRGQDGGIVYEIEGSFSELNVDQRLLLKLGMNMVIGDQAMNGISARKGGIDLNASNLNLQIKRDGKGVPLPLVQQDMAQLNRVQGFDPQIIEIKPLTTLPLLSELRQRLQKSSASVTASSS